MAEQKQTLLRQEPQNGTGQAFRTGTPESAGIPSEAVEWLLDELESGFTEPHGIMIMRNDILCAEGYWSPFAPGVIHGEQSHSKTYAATGIGIAYTEGLLSLDERLIDIFSGVCAGTAVGKSEEADDPECTAHELRDGEGAGAVEGLDPGFPCGAGGP